MASRPSFLFCVIATILYLTPALAFYPNITTPSYAVDFGLNVLSARAEPDCTPYKKTEGSFCGPLCGCDPGLTCISGKCSTASAPALVNPGCTSDDQCPDGMGCGWVTGNKVDGSESSLSFHLYHGGLMYSRMWNAICEMYETKRLFRSICLCRCSIHAIDQGQRRLCQLRRCRCAFLVQMDISLNSADSSARTSLRMHIQRQGWCVRRLVLSEQRSKLEQGLW